MEELYLIDNCGKRRKALEVTCNYCYSKFLKRLKWVKPLNFCNHKCKALYYKQNIEYKCSYCNNTFLSDKSRVNGSKSGLLFCSRLCKDNAQKIDSGIDQLKLPHYNDGYSEYRNRAFNKYKPECEYCKYSECIGILEVHHLDSNRLNGALENLVILCPTHHAAITRGYATMGNDRIFKWKTALWRSGSAPVLQTDGPVFESQWSHQI